MIDWVVVGSVVGPMAGAVVGAFAARAFERRVRLVAYLGHASAFRIQGPPEIRLHTHQYVIRNAGKQTATNVRVGHNDVRVDYNIYPDVPFTVETLPGGTKEIVISRLLAGEQVTLSYLYYPPVVYSQVNTYIKSDQGYAKVVTVLPQQQYPKWFGISAFLFMLLGMITVLYLLVLLARWVLVELT